MSKGSALNFENQAGVTIGDRYRLDRYLSSGAFGAVYKATHLAYGTSLRTVAIKIAKRPMQPSEARHAFHDALTMARVVDHAGRAGLAENFVAVFDAGICPEGSPLAGHPYMVMEFVTGTTLGDCLRSGPFPLKRAADTFAALLESVAFMHTPGSGGRPEGVVIHRDIKPDNILVDSSSVGRPRIKLTDFGLAIDLATVLSSTDSAGTLAYQAPESFRERENSPKSDVYSLAVVFYEMLSGKCPFTQVGRHLEGDSDAIRSEMSSLHWAARAGETFPELSSAPEMAARPELAAVIRAALAVEPEARPYRDAAEFLAAFRSAMDGRVFREENPADRARRLTLEAKAEIDAGRLVAGDRLLDEVMALHDSGQVPDHLLVGDAYLLRVKRLLAQQKVAEAGQLAQQAVSRRRTKSTWLAMAEVCRTQNPSLARHWEEEAKKLVD